jgi:hypothetical protein
VEANTELPWVVLYVKRWLHALVQLADGSLQERDRGTPQGSAISPVLANLFLHYAFDLWLTREFPGVRFERYVDDAVVHCVGGALRQPGAGPSGAGGPRGTDARGGAGAAPEQDQDCVLQGRPAA